MNTEMSMERQYVRQNASLAILQVCSYVSQVQVNKQKIHTICCTTVNCAFLDRKVQIHNRWDSELDVIVQQTLNFFPPFNASLQIYSFGILTFLLQCMPTILNPLQIVISRSFLFPHSFFSFYKPFRINLFLCQRSVLAQAFSQLALSIFSHYKTGNVMLMSLREWKMA